MENKQQMLSAHRRQLHQYPELGHEEFKTKAYLLQILKQYSCHITEIGGSQGTSLCTFFDRGKKKTVAFRCDMDALPIEEKNQVSYRSIHEGKMHACGHDAHMAMMLTFADELEHNLEALSCNVLLIFQAAEETTGAAKEICDSGILEKYQTQQIFGMHLWPGLPLHTLGSRNHELMAQSCNIKIEITGHSAHCARAEEGIDALYIACCFLKDVYAMTEHEIPEKEFRLLKFGSLHSGSVGNVISDFSVLEGSLRSFKQETSEFMRKRICEISADYESLYSCKFRFNYNQGYPPVVNDEALYHKTKNHLINNGFSFIELEKPVMITEDFSFYQHKVPGVFLFLGIGNSTMLHSPTFNFDETVMSTGLKTFRTLLELAD